MFWKKKVRGKAYRQRRDGAVLAGCRISRRRSTNSAVFFFLRKTFVLKSENTEFM
jgi:hypothetical protein